MHLADAKMGHACKSGLQTWHRDPRVLESAQLTSSPPTILTIEDDEAIRRGIVDALRYASYRVIEANGGDEALQAAIQQQYDLLLLDLVLPGIDGLKILAELRAVRPTTPVIILSARGEEDDRASGLARTTTL
jgi:DNA-binding response OmpR family regulator